MSEKLKPCHTCVVLTDEAKAVVARPASRMGCRFVCKECDHEAALLWIERNKLVEAAENAMNALKSLPPDALGIGGGKHDGATAWYIRDKLIADLQAAFRDQP